MPDERVFINCPLDAQYKPLMEAMVFAALAGHGIVAGLDRPGFASWQALGNIRYDEQELPELPEDRHDNHQSHHQRPPP